MSDGLSTPERILEPGRPQDLYIRPLFHLALLGKFSAVTDTDEHRKHTLGGLVQATFNKGYHAMTLGRNPYPIFAYSPSWARHITCRIDGVFAGANIDNEIDNGKNFLLYGVKLAAPNGNGVYIANPREDCIDITSSYSQHDSLYELASPRDLTDAKTTITRFMGKVFSA